MIEYVRNNDVAIFCGYSFKKMKDGYYRCYQRGEARGCLLHRYVFEKLSGASIPDGYDIHHVDGDKSNNEFSNLKLIKKAEHATLHNAENGKEKKCIDAMSKANKEKGYPGCKASREVQKRNGYPSLKKANQKKKKKIVRIGEDSEKTYDCLLDAAKDINKAPTHISECANGKKKTAFGYKWRWAE